MDQKFVEAEEVKNKISKLNAQLKTKRQKYLALKFQNDQKIVEERFKKELEEFDRDWAIRSEEFQINAKKLLSDLNIRQNYEIVELTKQLEMSMVKVMKFSNTYLDLKKQQENLIKQQMY